MDLMEIISNDWFWYVLGGFASNGFITQAVSLTPTHKDDKAVGVINTVIKALTGTFGLVKR
jgi:hypothetical protein